MSSGLQIKGEQRMLIRVSVAVLITWLGLCQAAQAAGFHCFGELSPQERMICGDKVLSALDYRLNALYSLSLLLDRSATPLRESQRDWMQNVRAKCTDIACLTSVYRERIGHLLRAVQDAAAPLPRKVQGRIQYPATDSPYCKVSGNAGTKDGDWFSLEMSTTGTTVSGTVDGIFDCGRKVWGDGGVEIKGNLLGNVALVHFQPGFSENLPEAEALIVIGTGRLYWRVLSEVRGESYVPNAEVISLKKTGEH